MLASTLFAAEKLRGHAFLYVYAMSVYYVCVCSYFVSSVEEVSCSEGGFWGDRCYTRGLASSCLLCGS